MIQLVEGDPEKELLVADRKAEGVRTGRTINDFLDYPEMFGDLVYLIFIQVGKWFNIRASITILAEISQDKLSAVRGPGNQETASFSLCVKMQHPGPDLNICK